MTFRELRRQLTGKGPIPIRWNKSGIVEVALVTPTGGIAIANAITKKVYRLPPNYKDIDVSVMNPNELVAIGDLLPKEMK